MYNVIVLAGGDSPERAVSLRSGMAVTEALRDNGNTVTQLDPADGLETRRSLIEQADAVFPVLHGVGGEDGSIQAILEAWHVPYVGSDVDGSQRCFDKWQYKQFLKPHGLTMPAGELVDIHGFRTSALHHQPFVLKPSDGGSSVDTFVVRDPTAFKAALAFDKHHTMLLEELIDGTEITVGVLDGGALPVIEIIPPKDGEFDYANKYNGTTQELCPPLHIGPAVQRIAQQRAVAAHRLCGCRHLSRSDFIVSRTGELYLLETNTMPGMTVQSLFPKMAATAGITMADLCQKLVSLAVVKKT